MGQQKRKLWRNYSLLTADEKVKFESWLKGELSQGQEKVLIMFQLIVQAHTPEHIFNTIFPNKSFSDSPYKNSFFRKLESQLNFYIEEFLAISAFRKNKFERDFVLAQEYNRRDEGSLFLKKLQKIRAQNQKTAVLDVQHFRRSYELETELQQYLHKHQIRGKESLAGTLSEALDDWWLHEKLKIAANNQNHYHVKGEKVNTLFIDEILKFIEENERYSQMPLLNIYKGLFLLHEGQMAPDQIKSLIKQQRRQIAEKELKDIFTLLFNYYGLRFNEHGEKQLLVELLDMFEWGIEDKLIFRDGYLPWDMFKNLITVTLRLTYYDKALDYLDRYLSLLPPEDQDEAYRFNYARFLFESSAYKEVLQYLNQRFSTIYYEIPARLIICRTHYELAQLDHLETELRSLRIYISRQKELSAKRKKIEINQIKLFEKLCRAYLPKDYRALREKVKTTQPLAERKWLMAKIQEKLGE